VELNASAAARITVEIARRLYSLVVTITRIGCVMLLPSWSGSGYVCGGTPLLNFIN
jgi:hypothetical protein